MADKIAIIPLRKVFTQPKDIVKKYIDIIIKEDIPAVCINRETGKKRSMPFKALYDNNNSFWQQDGSWEYFISAEGFEKVKEETVKKQDYWETAAAQTNQENAEPVKPAVDQGYGTEYEAIAAMSIVEKVQKINNANKRLTELAVRKNVEPEVIADVLVETTKDAALINHGVLLDALQHADGEAKELTQDVIDSTCELVKSSVRLVSEDIFNNELINTLVEKSNGTIVQHMTRVYLNGLAFLAYYNKLVSTSSAIQKLRLSFASRYNDFYAGLLPHISRDSLSLERVFYKGMRAITPDLFNNWAVGFLIHDIGKAAAVEYHEGEADYNRNIVIDHVKLGYTSVMNKTNYPREAGLITGYHHEYYGDSAGYGYFRAYLNQYKKNNPNAKQDFCIAYELEPILDFKAKAYFPAKILEIIDIYDSVTDPNRKYRKAMTPEEALAMMREEFVKKHRKIDAVLFDIFTDFVRGKKEDWMK